MDTAYHTCGGLWSHQYPWSRDSMSHGFQTASPTGPEQQGQSSSSGGIVSPQSSLTTINPGRSAGNSRGQDVSTSQALTTVQHEFSNSLINVKGVDHSVILLGVKGPRITLELAQIYTLEYCRDDIFFHTLKQQYKQCWGRLRCWLSVWRLNHCEFAKVISNDMVPDAPRSPIAVREFMAGHDHLSRQRPTHGYKNVQLRSATTARR